MNYRRLSLYLDRLQAYPLKRLASLEGWETADLLRVLLVLGMREEFKQTEHFTRRVIYGPSLRPISRPLKALAASSVIMNLRLPQGVAMLIDAYARRIAASRNQALAELILAGTKAYCQAELSLYKALKASREQHEPASEVRDSTND